mmetsp:Transcript_25896/g.36174  ORF Transcript_25896/g.36174 Transcript_25896/m.36174 type:complete len:110 (+) Transcript_25896:829-1158(+)
MSSFSSYSDDSTFAEDRTEIHKLLAVAELRYCDFFIFLNFKNNSDDYGRQFIAESVRELLELDKFSMYRVLNGKKTLIRQVETVVDYEELADYLKIDFQIARGCIGSFV